MLVQYYLSTVIAPDFSRIATEFINQFADRDESSLQIVFLENVPYFCFNTDVNVTSKLT